jgi:gamma-glutamylcyclotransferase (GGCT)/AIG2-like uncharacterized protein YtfP
VIDRLFVYGTLQPGDERWPVLAPYADGPGVPDTVAGSVFDTGLGYPAAIFSEPGTILGFVYTLRAESLDEGLAALDREESSVTGLFVRVVVTTGNGAQAWAYEYGGGGLQLTPIPDGRWRAESDR